MAEFPPLEHLGRRIMISGPSSVGKSTLALALGRRLGVPAIHLDQFRHLPNTDWQLRSDEDFIALHDAAIEGDSWVMDGNYSKTLPRRLERATGIILIADRSWASLYRYARRTLFEPRRAGALEGNRDSIKWGMIHWILVASPASHARYRQKLPISAQPIVDVQGMTGLATLYAQWGLER